MVVWLRKMTDVRILQEELLEDGIKGDAIRMLMLNWSERLEE
jgi:hypothetical protein